MTKGRNLSNSFSTGGGGFHFEAHIQASFVVLMLTGGYAPCLPCWPIKKIKLQGRIDGFETDDLIVVVEDASSKERRKLLGQIKHSIAITQGGALFGEVIQAAWNDFNNPEVFTKNKDIIALITGPLNATDAHNVPWLLNQARHTQNVDEFFRNVQQAKFSPAKANEKLQVIRHHLKEANDGNDVSNDELYEFLNHFHLIGYDLGNEFGVVLSLLHSHISQFQQQYPQWVWSRVVDIVQTWNQDAGTITPEKLPDDLREAFKQKVAVEMPEDFKAVQANPKTDWAQHPDATCLALTILIGTWQDRSQYDLKVITQLLGISYEEWIKKAREILHCTDSSLSLKNGIWKVTNRVELWKILGDRILDHDLDRFKSIALEILKELDPVFELPLEERYAAAIHGKVLKYSRELRMGISEGLAILGSHPKVCSKCSQGKVENTCFLVIDEIFTGAGWVVWGSLNDLLPTLAEAAPGEFLDSVEKAISLTPCPFDELFIQERSGITGRNYLTGLLWALEGLAWDEQYLVRVCIVLGELASHDLGGQWANRPSNSLATILLPWFPQTLASADKRKVAVETLLREWPDVAWELIVQLLPDQHLTSFGSHKPSWRMAIPDDWGKGVTNEEYQQQVSFYAELAVTAAGHNTDRLSTLIDHFDHLPDLAFDQLLETLASQLLLELPEEQRLPIWDQLTKFTNKHRRFSYMEWALPDELITRIEQVAAQLVPANPFILYQPLFAGNGFDLYEENDNLEEQQRKIDTRREAAISEIFQQSGIDGVIRFAKSVSLPDQVGYALGAIADNVVEQYLLQSFWDATDNKGKVLVSSFVWRRYRLKGWEWCDHIDRSDWTPAQTGQFLAYLPFNKESWDRASEWLKGHEIEYWIRTSAHALPGNENLAIAIEKLIAHGRPHAALNCLDIMRRTKQPIDTTQCVRALIAALSSSEPNYTMDAYRIIEIIKFLQSDPSVSQVDLFKVEWAYLFLLDHHQGGVPKLLESGLANSPEFFCKVIRATYRSRKEDQNVKEPTEKSMAIAKNAFQLLNKWKTVPGTQKNGVFSEECFSKWLQGVKAFCVQSGHLEVALSQIGKVLIHTPPDPGGLWIHCAVAAALNDHEAGNMRDGFRAGIYNSRGAHFIDPTGNPERELAKQFRTKADEVENAGFHRFAVTLKELADDYDREAERIVALQYQDG
ncbi:hypothetical protein LJC47_04215 [Desulfosarcina sp. OttesenSCG-928-B08]|nr:hypothetical protein [Desulfosarcina sp. OttesenSCG-928-B08]